MSRILKNPAGVTLTVSGAREREREMNKRRIQTLFTYIPVDAVDLVAGLLLGLGSSLAAARRFT